MELDLMSGKCDECSKIIRYDGENPPALFRISAETDKRYIQVCIDCLKKIVRQIHFSFDIKKGTE